METHLSDLIVPEVFGNYVQNLSLKTNRFVNSGILTADEMLGDKLNQPGTKITVPYLNDLDGDPDNWTDDTDIAPTNLTSGEQLGMKFYQNKAFGSTQLSRIISGAPIQETIAGRFASFWNRADEKMLLSVLKGAFEVDEVKNTKVFDATTRTPSDAAFGAKGFLATIGLMGDLGDNSLNTIAVNSATYSMMKAQNLIETIQPSTGGTPINTYNGMQIVLDDDISVEQGTKPTSIAYVFRNGAVRYSTQMQSTEIVNQPDKQGGRDFVIQKRIGVIHPAGISINPAFVSAKPNAPTREDFEKATAWELPKGFDPKNIGIVAYKFELDPMFVPATGTESSTSGSAKSSK